MGVVIRAATAADAEAVGLLVAEFQEYLRGLGDRTEFTFDAGTYLRDGFGANPAFAGFVAEAEGEVAGYLLYHFGYDTDRGQRLMHVIDLYVRQARRSRGIGRALMDRAAAAAWEAGADLLTWTVYVSNAAAFKFYERLGARYDGDLKLMSWSPPRVQK